MIRRSLGWKSLFGISSCWLLVGSLAPAQQPPIVETSVTTLAGNSFRHPSSLRVELAASSPLVTWPIVAEWDDHGRLVVLESAGVRQSVEEQRTTKPHRMVRLVDKDGDGKFDERIAAAENLPFPEGVLCLGKQILVSTPPEIISLTDEDGDGVCEKREVWFDGKTLTYCANDLHGPYLGRDGWIYWCKGAFAEQHHDLINGKKLVTKASHIFRRKIAGGPIEPVMTGGMDNPVEMAMTLAGERFFTSTFLQHPGGGLRDGIAHAAYGGVYGKDHNVIDDHLRTGPLMPIMSQLGPAAPSGLICLNSNAVVEDSIHAEATPSVLVAAQFNLQKVSAHQLVELGATFQTMDMDLLVGDRIDFHPTDVIEDADGSLLVLDTGGWYDLCCPSSGVDQERALGGIYRIRSKSTDVIDDPRGKKFAGKSSYSVAERQAQLSDRRWWVRRKAVDREVVNGDASCELLKSMIADEGNGTRMRQEWLWALCRIGTQQSLDVVEQALSSPHPELRQTALHALSVQRQGDPAKLARIVAADPTPQVRRAAAEGLGRVGDRKSVDALLAAFETVNDDRFLEHSILYALIELGDVPRLVDRMETASSAQQRACLMVLSQIAPKSLDAATVYRRAIAEDESLRAAAFNLLSKNPAWAQQIADQLNQSWVIAESEGPNYGLHRELIKALFREWRNASEIQQHVEAQLKSIEQKPQIARHWTLDVVTHMDDMLIPSTWTESTMKVLEQADVATQLQVADWFGRCKLSESDAPKVADWLAKHAEFSEMTKNNAFAMLRALPVVRPVSDTLGQVLVQSLTDADSEQAKVLAGQALSRVRLSPRAAELLLEKLSTIDPLLLPEAVAAVSRLNDDSVDSALLERLLQVPAGRTLNAETTLGLYKNRSENLQKLAKSTTEALAKPPGQIDETLSRWEKELPAGDAVAGFQVFRSTKAACSACHKIGYVGGTVGPDLTRIGATRTKRDLLEAILFPSVRFAQSYHPVRILTVNGSVFNGLVIEENGTEIRLQIAANKVASIEVSEIEERTTSDISLMPAGLDELISRQEIADLLELLQSSK